MTPDRPQKLLFVHTPKSAGVHTRGYLVDELGYDIFESVKRDQNKVWEDWTIDEIRSRIDTPSGLLMTHTLAHGWSPLAYSIPETTEQEVTEAIDVFKKAGWFTFTFIRHPGEQLCSFYHYVEALDRKSVV